MAATTPPTGPPPRHLAAVQRGLKRGLEGRARTGLWMRDETIITEPPPLEGGDGPLGEQVWVPLSGNRVPRILHGALNGGTGDGALLITAEGTQQTDQGFLAMVRAHGRGWTLVRCEDRASQHTAPDSRVWGDDLGIAVRARPSST